jgi:hypothetical protein
LRQPDHNREFATLPDEHIDLVESGRHNNEESLAMMDFAWLRTNVIQLWVDCFRLG